jgi:hypothetical protein
VLAEWSVAGGVEVGELVVDIDGDGADQSDAVGLGRGQGDALRHPAVGHGRHACGSLDSLERGARLCSDGQAGRAGQLPLTGSRASHPEVASGGQ